MALLSRGLHHFQGLSSNHTYFDGVFFFCKWLTYIIIGMSKMQKDASSITVSFIWRMDLYPGYLLEGYSFLGFSSYLTLIMCCCLIFLHRFNVLDHAKFVLLQIIGFFRVWWICLLPVLRCFLFFFFFWAKIRRFIEVEITSSCSSGYSNDRSFSLFHFKRLNATL